MTNGTATQRARRIVASYDTYAEAEKAVDHLSDNGFPVEHTAIVARDLKYFEQVTGRVRWIDALVRGALTGAITGFFVGWLFGVFNWFNPVVAAAWLAFDGLWFGAVVGSIFGLIWWALTHKRRDFESVGGITAERYEVLVDEQFADQAEEALARRVGAQAPAAPPQAAS